MKNVFLSLLFILLTSFSFSQTEERTIQFLNSMLYSHSTPMVNSPVVWKVDKYDTEGEEGYEKWIQLNMIISNELVSQHFIDCMMIDDVIINRAPNGNAGIEFVSRLGFIVQKYVGENPKMVNKLTVPLQTSDNNVNRIRKAFKHLLKLNGNKFPSDELFND